MEVRVRSMHTGSFHHPIAVLVRVAWCVCVWFGSGGREKRGWARGEVVKWCGGEPGFPVVSLVSMEWISRSSSRCIPSIPTTRDEGPPPKSLGYISAADSTEYEVTPAGPKGEPITLSISIAFDFDFDTASLFTLSAPRCVTRSCCSQ